jgi:hypothetical protein
MADAAPNHHGLDGLVEHIRTLPIDDQAELLRRVAPQVFADLDEADRTELVTDLNRAIVREAMAIAAKPERR